MRRFRALVAVAVAVPFALAGCGDKGKPDGSGPAPRVSAGGATFVDPIMQKWSGEYKKAKNVEIDYVAKGSGYGISNVTSKNIDFGCSDAPMNKKEVEAAATAGGEVVHVPVTVGAVAVIFNVPGVSELTLTGEVLADIYLRKITKWNDPRLAALNPGVPLPAADIAPVCRSESSGTTSIFTEYLSKRSAEFAKSPGTDKKPKWPEGVAGKPGNDGIAEQVKQVPNTIGYVEAAYAKTSGKPSAKLVNKTGKPVAPSAAAVTAAVEASIKVAEKKEPYSLHPLAFSFTDADGDAAYPIVGASYAILFKKQPKDKGPVIAEFLKWVVGDGQKFATDLEYAPLPADLTKKANDLIGALSFE
jgi:phosphate transport system substrate-binding protein